MIYLFRKRNKEIIAATKHSASSLFATPNNFITHQPEYLGAVTELDFAFVGTQTEEQCPIQYRKMVKVNGEDEMILLEKEQILDMMSNGDKQMESRYQGLVKKQKAKYSELMEALAEQADKTITPVSYDKLVGGVEDAKGDVSGVLKGYQTTK